MDKVTITSGDYLKNIIYNLSIPFCENEDNPFLSDSNTQKEYYLTMERIQIDKKPDQFIGLIYDIENILYAKITWLYFDTEVNVEYYFEYLSHRNHDKKELIKLLNEEIWAYASIWGPKVSNVRVTKNAVTYNTWDT